VLINAYWSPFARRTGFPVPDHPIINYLGEALTAKYFPRAIPRVFRHFASPLDAARARHGLRPVGSLLEMLTHASHTLYPDDPWLTPVDGAPGSHRFLGPVLWQPEWQPDLDQAAVPPPGLQPVKTEPNDPWYGLDSERPRLYVTLGSSGALRLLPLVIEALARLPVVAVVATAGRMQLGTLPPNVVARAFVRGADLARSAALVVFNGGSTTGYQALSQGTKVLGLPSNFDQYLAMEAIERAGAGLSIKARQATTERIRAGIESALSNPALDAAARNVAEHFAQSDSSALFRSFVEQVVEGRGAGPGAASRAG
jgi:UDP:flavonoid glycosyltransferase YjiC (YdhE family)